LLLIHGRPEEAERIVDDIEAQVERDVGGDSLEEPEGSITIRQRDRTSLVEVARTMFQRYPRRSVLGLSLMVSQAFFYNALFFTYALVLTAWLFAIDVLSATTQTIAWAVIFFIASASASSAHLTVSEVFPLETRALAIALFYSSLGTGVGGIGAPVLFGALIGTKERMPLTWGYLAGALLLIAALIEVRMGCARSRNRSKTWPRRWPRRTGSPATAACATRPRAPPVGWPAPRPLRPEAGRDQRAATPPDGIS